MIKVGKQSWLYFVIMSANSYMIMTFQWLRKHVFQTFKNIFISFPAFFPYRIDEFCAQETWKSAFSLVTQIIFYFHFLYSTYFPLKVKSTWEASCSPGLNLDRLYHITQLLEFIKSTIMNIQFITPIKYTNNQNWPKVRSSMNCYPECLRNIRCKKNLLYSLEAR